MRALSIQIFLLPVVLSAEVYLHVPPTEQQVRPKEIQFAPNVDSGKIQFDYRYGKEKASQDSLAVRVRVPGLTTTQFERKPYVAITFFSLNSDAVVKTVAANAEIENGLLSFELKGLEPVNMYNLKVSLAIPKKDNPNEGELVRDVGEYWGMTSGPSALDKGRFNFVSNLLVERDDWKNQRRGNWNAPYVGVPGGWCGQYPYICSRHTFKVFDEEPSESFRKWGKYFEKPTEKDLRENSQAGNYLRWTNTYNLHKMTMLGYSPKSGRVYTIEGNFADGIQITQRGVNEVAKLGVLTSQMLWDLSK